MKKGSKNAKTIIKIIVYAVLIIGCVVLFIVFGSKRSEPAYQPDEDKIDTQKTEPPSLPFCYELINALKESGIPCEFSEPTANPDGTISCQFLFENKHDDGCIIITPDDDFHVISCELQLSYLYVGAPPVEEINKTLTLEYERREALHKELIPKYLNAVISVLDYNDLMNRADILTVTDAVIKSYSDMKVYDKKFGILRFNTHTDCKDSRSTFLLVITPNTDKKSR